MFAEKIARLDKAGWLASEGERLGDGLAEAGHWVVYGPGQVIYSASDPSDGLHGLGSGTLSVRFPLIAEEPVFLHLAEPGFWIGDAAELAKIPRVVTLLAASRSRVLHVPSRAIQSLLSA